MTARHKAASSGSSSVAGIVTRLDFNFGSGVFFVEPPFDMLLFDLSVVTVDFPLETVEDDGFIKVWSSR
jgi:hypothetical protein